MNYGLMSQPITPSLSPSSPFSSNSNNNYSPHHENDDSSILTDGFTAIAPRVTGALSALSSSLIIYIIARSRPKLSTIYHRIMFMMSCADILSSVSVGLSTLPMPMPMSGDEDTNTDTDYYHWTGTTRIGNNSTCTAQGFFYVFGMTCMFLYNASLCIYYTCTIAFEMEERNIQKYVEPLLHIVPLVISFVAALMPVVLQAYSYGPIGDVAWCTIASSSSIVSDGSRGERGRAISIIFSAIGIWIFLQILACFALILWKVIQKQRMRTSTSTSTSTSTPTQVPKVICIQALAYVLALLISLSAPIISAMVKRRLGVSVLSLTRLQATLMPIQGFFNAIIFVSHMVYNYHRAYPDLSMCRILYLLLFVGYDEPVVLSRMYIVHLDHERGHNGLNLFFDRHYSRASSGDLDLMNISGVVSSKESKTQSNSALRLPLNLEDVDVDVERIGGDGNSSNGEDSENVNLHLGNSINNDSNGSNDSIDSNGSIDNSNKKEIPTISDNEE